jgi:ribosomal protein S6
MNETTEQVIKEYELSYVLKDEADFKSIQDLLIAHGGEVFSETTLRNIVLSYPIKKQTQAFFGFLHFRIDPEKIKTLDHDLKFNTPVLRFLIVTPPFIKGKFVSAPRLNKSKSSSSAPKSETPVVNKPDVMPLSNEDLEKKIEEILN